MLANEIGVTIIVSTMMFLLLIAGVIIVVFISNRRNTNQEMKMVQMQIDYEKELRTVQHEVQEQVLVNVGRELHDNIGQLLTSMNLQLERHKVVNPGSGTLLQAMGGTLSDTIQEVKRLGKSLNSDLFDTQGLIHTMQLEVDRLRQLNRYQVLWEYDMEPNLNTDQKVIVFRIFQEILNNIIKHASGGNIHINLSGKNNFRMVLSDDGKGFDRDEMMRSPKGSGLKNMVKRAELAKLVCRIDSVIGKGTTFTLEQIKNNELK